MASGETADARDAGAFARALAVILPFRSRRFEIVARLGAGGMGVVYEAIDHERNARVALKTIRDPAPGALMRFKNEFRALHDIRHPNLVALGELHEEDGVWFFTMELVDGVDLLRWVRGGNSVDHRSSRGSPPPKRISLATLGAASTPQASFFDRDAATIALPSSTPIAPPVDSPSIIGEAETMTVAAPSGPAIVRFDEARLRAALRQLTEALMALHAARRIHRDIKPSNLLITKEGRVVLLDFGLVSSMTRTGSTNLEVVGTAEYMAPEQASARHVGPPADWYAVGVLLFEVLVGRFPFAGTSMQQMADKQARSAPPPSTLMLDVPTDLDRLCVDLLRRDPSARPSGEEVLRRLGEGAHGVAQLRRITAQPVAHEEPFVGRAIERASLHDAATPALDATIARPVAIVIEGESGVGKSALMERFVDDLRARAADTLVLRGRCYERETVTFKALDGVVDALAAYLHSLAPIDVAGLLPLHASLLLEAFPVLGIVDAIAHAPRVRQHVASPAERRNRLFDAMRELFQRLRARGSVVLAIDDVQWADADSLELLREIARPPDGAPLLIVGTMRPLISSGETGSIEASRAGPFASLATDVHTVRVGRLSIEEARTLSGRLASLRGRHAAPIDLEAIVAESEGHPLFIDALVRHAQTTSLAGTPSVRLDAALWERVASLGEAARTLVEVVGLMGAPVAIELAREAAGIPREQTADVVHHAQLSNLVKTTGPRLTDRIEPYHDRVAESVTARLSQASRVNLHRTIAAAITAIAPREFELLATHLLGCGDRAGAVRNFLLAARASFDALAIDHAADLYRKAIALGIEDRVALRDATIALGDVLAIAGRGADAAIEYQRATAFDVDANTDFELRRRVAEQLLQSGHLREGVAALAEVLERIGIPYAKTRLIAVARALLRKLFLFFRGYGVRVRERADVDAREVVKLDVLWTAVRGLVFIDFLRGFDFLSRFVLLALSVGDRRHVANALAAEASSGAVGGDAGVRRSVALFAQLDEVSAPIDDPAVVAHNHSHRSFRHYYAGQFAEARREGELGMSLYAEHCTGVNWYLGAMRLYLVFAYYYLGDFRELQRRLRPWRDDAHRRHDLFAMAACSLGVGSVSFLIDDDVAGARADVDRALAGWAIDGFTSNEFQALVSRTQIDLYEGDVEGAHTRVEAIWPEVERSWMLGARNFAIEGRHLRARVAIASAQKISASEAKRRRARAERLARKLVGDGLDWSRGFGELVLASVAKQRDDRAACEARLRAAIGAFDRAGMRLYAAASRARLGETIAGDEGRRALDEARAVFVDQGVACPEKMIAMMAPGFS